MNLCIFAIHLGTLERGAAIGNECTQRASNWHYEYAFIVEIITSKIPDRPSIFTYCFCESPTLFEANASQFKMYVFIQTNHFKIIHLQSADSLS